MKYKFFIFAIFSLFLFSNLSYAKIETITCTVKQPFGGSQSADDARIAGMAKAKLEALEKAGTYLESFTKVKNAELEQEEITALSAGILKAEVISQENYATDDSFGIIIVAKVDVDTDILDEKIDKLLKDRELLGKYQEVQEREKQLLAKIDQLEKENEQLKKLTDDNQEQKERQEELRQEFRDVSKQLNAIQWNNKALSLWSDGKYNNPDKAVEYLNTAIYLDPGQDMFYINRGLAWYYYGRYNKAIKDYNRAIALNTKRADAYYNRGLILYKIGYHNLAIKDYNKFVKLRPKMTESYHSYREIWKFKSYYNHTKKHYVPKFKKPTNLNNLSKKQDIKPKKYNDHTHKVYNNINILNQKNKAHNNYNLKPRKNNRPAYRIYRENNRVNQKVVRPSNNNGIKNQGHDRRLYNVNKSKQINPKRVKASKKTIIRSKKAYQIPKKTSRKTDSKTISRKPEAFDNRRKKRDDKDHYNRGHNRRDNNDDQKFHNYFRR